MFAQRFVDMNPQFLVPAILGCTTPQSNRAVPRRSGDPIKYAETLNEPTDFSDSGAWVSLGGNLWGLVLTTQPERLVFERNSQQFLGRRRGNILEPTFVQVADWNWKTSVLYVYSESDPNGFYTGIWPDFNAILASTLVPVPKAKAQRLERFIWHPGFNTGTGLNQAVVYPQHPHRTINYYRSAVRKYDITAVKTLQSNINVLDLQQWEDVVISEVWEGGRRRLSMMAEFFDMLHLFRITPTALGRNMGWAPKDLGYQRHIIQPVSLGVGTNEADVHEFRERPSTSMDSWIDGSVVFSFKLVRPAKLVDSLLIAEGY